MRRLRSLLFVPGDRPERMAKALGMDADALILDLEDAVAPARKAEARAIVAGFLRDNPPCPGEDLRPHLFVRVNPLDSGLVADDLAALLPARPEAIMLPKAEGAASVERLRALGVDVPILPIATETPAAIFQLGSYPAVAAHLAGLTWGAEDLPAAIGATAREADGRYTAPMELARSLTLFAAHAAGIPAIETVYPDFRDLEGLARYAARGRRDGFSGMMAIHPSQLPVINAAFGPAPDEIDRARRIVALFAASPRAGALQLDGRMVDAPHLAGAQRLLALDPDRVAEPRAERPPAERP